MSYKLKELLKKMFDSSTKGGRVARTALQAFIALTSFSTAILATPELADWFSSLNFVAQMGGLSVCIAFVTAVHNYAKDVWHYVKG